MLNLQNFKVSVDERKVLTATLDVPGRPVNVFDDSVLKDLYQIVVYARDNAHSGVEMLVFRSGKPAGFLAGADIHRLQNIRNEEEAEWILRQGQDLFNSLEELSIPTLAVIHGACVGGGLEFVMSCRYRLAVNDPSTKLGLPEVKLGLIPAWGGTQRLPKKAGLMQALPMMLEGKLVPAEKAARIGLVDATIPAHRVDEAVNRFIEDRLAGRPLTRKSRTWTQWILEGTAFGRRIVIRKARQSTAKLSLQYPALKKIIDVTEVGLDSPEVTAAGLQAEREAFTKLLLGPVAPNLINIFMDQEKAKKGSTWTRDVEPLPVKKIAVIGAGTMGAGIAQLAASRGYDVILQDIKEEFVNRGMDTIRGLFSKAVEKKAMSQSDADESLARLQPRVNWGPSDDVDLMVEAIIERLDVKETLFKEADERLPARAVLASNTSALPVNEMAKFTSRPEHVAGLHFFNPVHKMPLVEVVRAPGTSDETIATLVAVSKKLGKVPIVVRQSPGFLVNRILFPYLDEAARLAVEGYSAKEIDKAAKKFGMPMGPIELLDVVGIDVALDVSKTLSPLAMQATPSPELFEKLSQAGHKGQKTGQGFYIWTDGKRGEPAEQPQVPNATRPQPVADWVIGGETFDHLQQRLMLSMINEARKCLAEQVVREAWMVDLGMVLGTGFSPFRGGPMQCIQRWGEDEVINRLKLLQQTYGERFEPDIESKGEANRDSEKLMI
ncbi:3-hydroxyacyl-CoA dehydrogenase NAD-binding domain-containing protein [Planctomicrobium sp. SH661]|uniref:3-hydroxyacyl-CoA dehydrogenase NAD-binding domain-containing protein n=1 Tax=Planctomicrobium sp. SH661 TaxID=3448124 RepID=UPI003F5C06FE